ncbi:hypothetical protein AHAS_Ahas20G0193300 [Arachis hypogaea]
MSRLVLQVVCLGENLELACHVFDTKWHTQPLLWPSSTLACHAWMLKWHAQVRIESWRATPSTPSDTPSFALVFLSAGVPRLDLHVAHPSDDLKLACHAFDTKWHVQPFGPSTPSLETCTGVPHLDAQVARPLYCGSSKLGVPRLDLQVARPSDELKLACHAFNTKWHAQVIVSSGLMN